MMQASLIKLSMLAALIAPIANAPGAASEKPLQFACLTQPNQTVPSLDWDRLTISDLEALAESGHPDALYWRGMRAMRERDTKPIKHRLMLAGQAGSPDAWWRLADMARSERDLDQSRAYQACGGVVEEFRARHSNDAKPLRSADNHTR